MAKNAPLSRVLDSLRGLPLEWLDPRDLSRFSSVSRRLRLHADADRLWARCMNPQALAAVAASTEAIKCDRNKTIAKSSEKKDGYGLDTGCKHSFNVDARNRKRIYRMIDPQR